MNQTIALLTDFGITDTYVGTMKAVMQRICPQATFIDITHAVQPQNVRQGAFALMTCYRYFAPGTIFLVVVDPGVGSTRRALAAQAGDYKFVGPDNGILSYALADHETATVVELTNPGYRLSATSNTFHGRDIFAPAAAHLATSVKLADMGPTVTDYYQLLPPQLQIDKQRVTGEVIHIDHFGNAVTSIGELRRSTTDGLYLISPLTEGGRRHPALPLTTQVSIQIKGQTLSRIHQTYSETAPGTPLALIGSSGYLEIAVNQGSATAHFGLTLGDTVTLTIG